MKLPAAPPPRPEGLAVSMYRRLAPRIFVPLYERLSGRRPWTELRRLRELQWRAPEELEARALAKLRPLLAHAYVHVPYYRELFARAGLRPEDIGTVSDLARLPLTGKAELRAGFPLRVVADDAPARQRWLARTSGSAGLPFEFYGDRAASDVWLASYLFFREWAGVVVPTTFYVASPSHLAANPRASPWIKLARRIVLGERVVHLSGIDLGAARFAARLRRVVTKSGYAIWGWPAYLARLGAELLEAGIELSSYPRGVVTYGESLTETDARVIERAFQCRVANHYSSWEILHLAQTCPDNPRLLHVNSERAIVRVVREDGSPAAVGEPGRVVITDLANRVMPFINYDIGDRAQAGAPCPCGRGFPTLMGLEGRVGELIRTPGGKTLSPVALGWLLTHAHRALPYIWEYQAVQTAADALVLRIVPTDRFTREVALEIEHALIALLGSDITVKVEAVDHIAVEPSGKRLIIKSELAPR